jgi:hypothetical protein
VRPHNPYLVGEVKVDPMTAEPITSSLHGPYSGLNKTLELPFAQELDQVYVTLCRTSFLSKFANLPSLAKRGASIQLLALII